MPRRTATLLTLLGVPLVGAALWWGLGGNTARAAADPFGEDELQTLDAPVRQRVGEALAARSSSPDGWGRLGVVCAANGLSERARTAFTHAAREQPSHPRWPYLHALMLARTGHPMEAAAQLERAAQLQDDYAPIHWRLAVLYLEQGRLEEARVACERALEIDPGDAAGWATRGRTSLQLDRTEEGIRDLRRALSLRPEDRYVLGLLGVAYRQAGRPLDAAEPLRLGQGAQPSYVDPWKEEMERERVATQAWEEMRAAQLRDAGRPGESIEILEKIRADVPDDVTVLNGLGSAYARAERYEEALAVLDALLAVEPENRQGLFNRATVLGNLERFDEAHAAVRELLEQHPTYAAAHQAQGGIAYRQGDLPAAAAAYRLALDHDDRNARVRVGLGKLELELERWVEAETTLTPATRGDHPLPDAWAGLAQAQVRLGKLDAAQRSLDALEQLDGVDGTLLARVRLELRRARSGEER